MSQRRRQITFDRFIQRRPSTDFETTQYSLNNNDLSLVSNKLITDEDYYFVNVARKKYYKENYRNALRGALFSDENKFSKGLPGGSTNKQYIYNWPVEPRSKPLLSGSPSVLLDMPDLETDLCKNVVDWGKTGYIATTFESEAHIWHPEKKIGVRVLDVNDNAIENCIKWNKDGKQIVIALKGGQIAIYDMENHKTVCLSVCACQVEAGLSIKKCSVISAEWTKSNYLVTGCSRGTISCRSHSLRYLRYRYKAHSDHIIKLTISCEENFLASVGNDGTILIWKYPEMEIISTVNGSMPTKAIAWHPWHEKLLVISKQDHYFLWNIQNNKKENSAVFTDSYIDNLTFNPTSAELLVSLYNYRSGSDGISYLTVMKNLNNIVDDVRCNNCRIPYLLWNYTGTKLGTASTDENFCIWDFFGRSSKYEKNYLQLEQISILTNMNILGNVIR